MFTTNIKRMNRNKQRTCLHRNYGQNGICMDCGKVHKKKQARYHRLLAAEAETSTIIEKIVEASKGVKRNKEKQTIEVKN